MPTKYLISTIETYRVDTEEAATKLIEESKENGNYILGKYTSEHKERRSKGEVVEEFWKVTLTKIFNDIKDPDTYIKVEYEA